MPWSTYNRKGSARTVGKLFRNGVSSVRYAGLAYRRFVNGMKQNPVRTISRVARGVVRSGVGVARAPLGVAGAIWSSRKRPGGTNQVRFKRRRVRVKGSGGARGSIGPMIKSRAPRDMFARYNRDGIVYNDEQYGIKSDSKCVYLESTVVTPIVVIRVIVKALLRRLFEKAGINISSVNEIISTAAFHVGAGSSTAFVFLSQYNSDNLSGWSNVTHTMSSVSTLETVADAFYQTFYDYSSGFDNASGAGNVKNLLKPMTFSFIVSGTTLSQIDITAAYVDIMARNVFKVQNSTEAYSAISTEDEDEVADNVASVPLQGKCYRFNGLPRTKLHNSRDLPRDNNMFGEFPVDKMIKLITGSVILTEFQEPPGPQSFWNCNSCTNIRINPGEIRTYTLYYKSKRVNLLEYLKRFRLEYSTVTSGYATATFPLPVCLIGLEEVIQSTSINPLRVRYEAEGKIGARIIFKKSKYCRTQTNTLEVI